VLERRTSKVSEEANRDLIHADSSQALASVSSGSTAFSSSQFTDHSSGSLPSIYSETTYYNPQEGPASMTGDRETIIGEEDIQLVWDFEEVRQYIESELQAAQASYWKISSHALERKRSGG